MTRALRRGGFTLLEVAASMSVIAIALVATLGAIGTSTRASSTITEQEIATRAASAVLEEMAAVRFADLLATYDASPANDPVAPGRAPGEFFAVPELAPADGAAAAEIGRIVLPTIGAQLREDGARPELGMPRDLNGDGKIDSRDHAADYRVLPALVEVRWRGAGGPCRIAIPCVFAAR
ncbi:MAG TPA: type II secretion system protein [Planctomycetota bacterium]|nr:type II secretion system protein [Planctomycetota bacterium]